MVAPCAVILAITQAIGKQREIGLGSIGEALICINGVFNFLASKKLGKMGSWVSFHYTGSKW